jgi:TetR/AcrR family transcriptional regulator, copper-responsive repressor
MTKGRPRSFDRDDVLRRAMLLFWKHGYDATSISLLTEAMGIGAPSLYAAFGDKRALFKEALEHYMTTYGSFMIQARQCESDPRAAIERMLLEAAAMFTSAEHPPGCMIITAATNCAPESAAVEKRLRAIRASTVHAIEEKIAKGRRSLPRQTNAHTLALFFSATLQGMSAQARDGASREELEAIARAALCAWPA